MISIPCVVANSLWLLANLPQAFAFRRALGDAAKTQERVLLEILQRHRHSDFGRRHRFAEIQSIADFQQRVPLATWEDFATDITRIAAGEKQVLTGDPVTLLEPTSGSTAASKLIPFTGRLREEFQRAIAPWLVCLFLARPNLFGGPAYWSLTPVSREDERSPGGIPIGFEEDSEYFGRWQRRLVDKLMAVPSLVRRIPDMESFFYVTLLFLLRRRALRLISVWNPTFLSLLLERLPEWAERLAGDIADGRISTPKPLPEPLATALRALNRPDRKRAQQIRQALQPGGTTGDLHTRLWPKLRLISCWTDAGAARFIPDLQRLFPRAEIQGKGLIATEGIVSFPLDLQGAAALALRSHFFEFIHQDSGDLHLAHELEKGDRYSVVLTTGGGLYRYRLHDLVEITGHRRACPILKFIGKEAHISDRFGEKLNERHVREALDRCAGRENTDPAFAMLACEERDGRFAYTLFIEGRVVSEEILHRMGGNLEEDLRENYHYRYCRDLGQLDPVRVFRIREGGREAYLEHCRNLGQRLGDIKPSALHRLSGWTEVFRGDWLRKPD
jgi:hypothetical protein